MAIMLKTGRCLVLAIVCTIGVALRAQPPAITITLTGQSMIRSDIRETAPAAVPVIRGLLKGDVVFTNLEAAVAEKGETIHEGRGFLTPPEALDALTTFGFNLLSLSGNHAFDLKLKGVQNTLRERTTARSFMPAPETTWPRLQPRVICTRRKAPLLWSQARRA